MSNVTGYEGKKSRKARRHISGTCKSDGVWYAHWTPEDWAILTGRALGMYAQELRAAEEAGHD